MVIRIKISPFFVILHYNAGLKSPLYCKKRTFSEKAKVNVLKESESSQKKPSESEGVKKVVDTGGGINRQPFLISNDDTTKKVFFAAFFPL